MAKAGKHGCAPGTSDFRCIAERSRNPPSGPVQRGDAVARGLAEHEICAITVSAVVPRECEAVASAVAEAAEPDP
jgi:hypothetical protein